MPARPLTAEQRGFRQLAEQPLHSNMGVCVTVLRPGSLTLPVPGERIERGTKITLQFQGYKQEFSYGNLRDKLESYPEGKFVSRSGEQASFRFEHGSKEIVRSMLENMLVEVARNKHLFGDPNFDQNQLPPNVLPLFDVGGSKEKTYPTYADAITRLCQIIMHPKTEAQRLLQSVADSETEYFEPNQQNLRPALDGQARDKVQKMYRKQYGPEYGDARFSFYEETLEAIHNVANDNFFLRPITAKNLLTGEDEGVAQFPIAVVNSLDSLDRLHQINPRFLSEFELKKARKETPSTKHIVNFRFQGLGPAYFGDPLAERHEDKILPAMAKNLSQLKNNEPLTPTSEVTIGSLFAAGYVPEPHFYSEGPWLVKESFLAAKALIAQLNEMGLTDKYGTPIKNCEINIYGPSKGAAEALLVAETLKDLAPNLTIRQLHLDIPVGIVTDKEAEEAQQNNGLTGKLRQVKNTAAMMPAAVWEKAKHLVLRSHGQNPHIHWDLRNADSPLQRQTKRQAAVEEAIFLAGRNVGFSRDRLTNVVEVLATYGNWDHLTMPAMEWLTNYGKDLLANMGRALGNGGKAIFEFFAEVFGQHNFSRPMESLNEMRSHLRKMVKQLDILESRREIMEQDLKQVFTGKGVTIIASDRSHDRKETAPRVLREEVNAAQRLFAAYVAELPDTPNRPGKTHIEQIRTRVQTSRRQTEEFPLFTVRVNSPLPLS